jgi:hypothetical protein
MGSPDEDWFWVASEAQWICSWVDLWKVVVLDLQAAVVSQLGCQIERWFLAVLVLVQLGVALVLPVEVLGLWEVPEVGLELVWIEAALVVGLGDVMVSDFGERLDDSSHRFESIYSRVPVSDFH